MTTSVIDEWLKLIEHYTCLCNDALKRGDMLRYAEYKDALEEIKNKSHLRGLSKAA